jgi:hypothetical protein
MRNSLVLAITAVMAVFAILIASSAAQEKSEPIAIRKLVISNGVELHYAERARVCRSCSFTAR